MIKERNEKMHERTRGRNHFHIYEKKRYICSVERSNFNKNLYLPHECRKYSQSAFYAFHSQPLCAFHTSSVCLLPIFTSFVIALLLIRKESLHFAPFDIPFHIFIHQPSNSLLGHLKYECHFQWFIKYGNYASKGIIHVFWRESWSINNDSNKSKMENWTKYYKNALFA